MLDSEKPITQLLRDWRNGHKEAVDQLVPIVYQELRRLARRQLAPEGRGHTLQTTALVHEAYIRLVGADIEWQDRAHFFAVAARMMRRILVDHAKSQKRQKRGGQNATISLEEAATVPAKTFDNLLEVDEALRRLTEQDPRKGEIVELHLFGGLTYEETATVLVLSEATVHRELRLAKAWLYHELKGGIRV